MERRMALAVAKHRGRKSSPRPIRLKCGRCDYEWDYYGRRDRYGTNCPRCQGWVTIPFQFREIPPRKTQAQGQRMRIPSKPGVFLQCPKCGHQWIYTGKYVQDIVAGKRVHLLISCPKCLYRISVP